MITSSPMIARLPLTRPAISVTRRDVVRGPRLVHDRELGLDHLREALGLLGAAGVGRDRDDALAVEAEVAEVAREERQRRHVVDGDREEALDLAGVEVHRQDPVGAGDLEQVGDEAGRDRLARLRLAVLAGVREERDHGGDALRGAELRRLDHLQELHQVLVDRAAAGLDEEDVGAADRLVVADVGLAVRERRSIVIAPSSTPSCSAIASASSGCERPANTISRFCGPRSIQWPGCGSVTAGEIRVLEPGEHELSRPAAELHIPPCSPGARARPRAHPAGTSFVIVDPAAVHAPSPTSTGATKPFWIPVLTFLPIRVRLFGSPGLVGEVRGDRAGADVRVLADLGVADVRQVRHLRPRPDA